MIINFPKSGKRSIRETLILGILLNKSSTPFFAYSYLRLTILLLVSVISTSIQRQPLEVFCQKMCCQKSFKIDKKTLVSVFFLKKGVFCIKKETLALHRCFLVNFLKFLRTLTFFTEHLRTIASVNYNIVANSHRFTKRLPGFVFFSQIPHKFGIVIDFSQIL